MRDSPGRGARAFDTASVEVVPRTGAGRGVTVTFGEAREIVRTQLLPARWPAGPGEPVVRATGEQSERYFRVHMDLAEGDDLMDPPVIFVDRSTGHLLTLPWTAMLDPETPTEPVSD